MIPKKPTVLPPRFVVPPAGTTALPVEEKQSQELRDPETARKAARATKAPQPEALVLQTPAASNSKTGGNDPLAAETDKFLRACQTKSTQAMSSLVTVLVEDLATIAEPQRSRLAEHLAPKLPWYQTDNFARALFARFGETWLRALDSDTRRFLVRSVREHWISAGDREVHNSLIGPLRREILAAEMLRLGTAQGVTETRNKTKTLLGDGRTVRFRGADIPAPAKATSQWAVDFFYRHLGEKPVPVPFVRVPFSSPEEIAQVLATPKVVSPRTGKPVHLEGTVFYRPGLGNVAPSPANLFRMAQHSDKLVLAFPHDDGSEASAVRELTSYRGIPVPPELQGKLFAVGREERMLQTGRAGAGVLIEQLERLHESRDRFGFDLEHITAVAHSQGNLEIALARLVLAAHGFPEVFERHIGVAPALRGSLVADNQPLLALFGWALAGFDEVGQRAINDLDPDAVAALLPEFMRTTVDLSVLGITEAPNEAAIEAVSMQGTSFLAEEGLQGPGSDGLVDQRIKDFVRDPRKFVLTDKRHDHLAIILDPEAVDAWLVHVEPPAPESRTMLRRLAGTEPPPR